MNKNSISNFITIAFFLLFFFTNYAVAQNQIIARQDSNGEEVIITSDDIEMHAVMFRPPKGSKPGPAIILVHGWMPYGEKASWDTNSAKRIASYGYTTLAITMRGWPDTGDEDDCGWKQPYDVVNAVNWLATQKGVDPNRIGLLGASQGGQVNLFAASLENSIKIKAVIAYFPVPDIKSWLGKSDLSERIKMSLKERCSQGITMDERSPLFRADKIKASVLIIHGDQDTNIPIAESEVMIKALVDNGANAELYVVKGGTHHYDGSPAWEKSFLKMIEFFSKNL
tara:strand:- start:228 stop:1076 length:849 start_codon:yes stop_codon:yes gene_type:complete